MTELGAVLERLGLDQYLDALVGEGFDTWETVLDIQETDLDALNVKLGHRRKLQREIANFRGIPYERLVTSPAQESSSDAGKSGESSQANPQPGDRATAAAGDVKRKYRRHPKPDEHAPERPPSAYVIFSNKVRDEIKGESLSFTAIAKLVGERWQKLDPSEKEPCESQAAAAKEHYNIQLSTYKKTEAYREYVQYLADFKAKHAGPPEGKRPKLDKEPSVGSMSGKSMETIETGSGHRRDGSVGSMGSVGYVSSFASPAGISLAFASTGSSLLGVRKSAGTSPHGESPPPYLQVDPKLRSAISTQSSTSEDSWAPRPDLVDSMQRPAQLSLVTAPSTVYQALSSLPSIETSSSDESGRRSSRLPYLTGQRDAPPLPPLNPDAAGYQPYRSPGTGSGSGLLADERWRPLLPEVVSRPLPDLPRPFPPPLPMGQNATFGATQLPPLVSVERLAETPHEHFQRTLPPPRLPSPRKQAHLLPSLSRARTAPVQPSSATTGQSGRVLDPPHLDRSESEAVTTLARLASTGKGGEGSESQDPSKPVQR